MSENAYIKYVTPSNKIMIDRTEPRFPVQFTEARSFPSTKNTLDPLEQETSVLTNRMSSMIRRFCRGFVPAYVSTIVGAGSKVSTNYALVPLRCFI